MADLLTLLAAKRHAETACQIQASTDKLSLELACRLYDRMQTNIPWEEQEEVLRMFVLWLGTPAVHPDCDPKTNTVGFPMPHWSQINPQCFRLASMLLPKDAYYVEIQNLNIRIWHTYKTILDWDRGMKI